MRNAVCIGLIVVCGCVGAFLAAGYGQDDRSIAWYRSHLKEIRSQLAGLKEHVLAYRKTHGRYPTNDEGLGGIDDFELRVKIQFRRDRLGDSESLPYDGFYGSLRLWDHRKHTVSRYRLDTESHPESAKESLLLYLGLLADSLDEQDTKSANVEAVAAELAIGHGDNLFLLRDGVVLSPWWIPYVYENRNGHKEAAFSASPVNDAGSDKYSIKVDQGVYISSSAAPVYVKKLDALWLEVFTIRMIGGGLIVVALALLVVMIRGKAAVVAGLAALVVSGAGGVGFHMLHHATCYIMNPLFSHRTPEMVQRQKELLSKYRDAGVITEATYKRALDAAQPTNAPAEP